MDDAQYVDSEKHVDFEGDVEGDRSNSFEGDHDRMDGKLWRRSIQRRETQTDTHALLCVFASLPFQ